MVFGMTPAVAHAEVMKLFGPPGAPPAYVAEYSLTLESVPSPTQIANFMQYNKTPEIEANTVEAMKSYADQYSWANRVLPGADPLWKYRPFIFYNGLGAEGDGANAPGIMFITCTAYLQHILRERLELRTFCLLFFVPIFVFRSLILSDSRFLTSITFVGTSIGFFSRTQAAMKMRLFCTSILRTTCVVWRSGSTRVRSSPTVLASAGHWVSLSHRLRVSQRGAC